MEVMERAEFSFLGWILLLHDARTDTSCGKFGKLPVRVVKRRVWQLFLRLGISPNRTDASNGYERLGNNFYTEKL